MSLNRRQFLATSAATLFASQLRADSAAPVLPIAFSTLGCPAWDLDKILTYAQSAGFAAVELRGLQGNMDLPARPEFAPDRIAATKAAFAAHQVKIACVSSSAAMHESDPTKRAQNISDAKKFIDLASALGCPYVRVFGNNINGPKEEVVARVADGLRTLGEYSGPRHVTVIIESHGDFTDSPTLKDLLTRANSPYVALLWDAHHTFATSHEDPEFTVRELGQWIRHTHLKDSVPDGKDRRYVLPGEGDVPIARQVRALQQIHYTGYFCFEWEKVWHPDIPVPEIAFPAYVRYMRPLLTTKSS